MTFRRYLHKPKGQLVLVLGALAALAAIGPFWEASLLSLAVSGVVAVAIDAPLTRLRKKRWELPDGALLTGMIVSMVLARQVPLHVVAVTSAVAVGSKQVFRTPTTNVFNPAAFGLFATYFFYHPPQDWWGSMPEHGAGPLVILILAGLFIVRSVHKFPLLVAFLGSYYLLFTLAAHVGDPAAVAGVFRGADLRAVLYLAFFMVTDPPTSPPRPGDQVIFGLIAAAGCFAVRETVGAVYFFLAGLLIANAWEGWRRWRAHLRHQHPACAVAAA